METIKKLLFPIFDFIRLFIYQIYVSIKAQFIRKKSRIRVLFVVSELSSWKSELLYTEMLKHSRFVPIIGVSTCKSPINYKKQLVQYLSNKQYQFVDLDESKTSIRDLHPDIIFYYKPYIDCYSKGHYFNSNLKYLFCGMNYCFSITQNAAHVERDLFDYCWQYYAENKDVAERNKKLLGYKARNTRVTGIPTQDILLQSREMFDDPWKEKTGKIRIIYAPHHSMQGTNGKGIELSTFLKVGEQLLEITHKYQDKVYFAFKPHPLLYEKLLKIWGKQKTDDYYHKWEQLNNAQIETGEYIGLFKYSDAIIHDCASFLIEYLYMDKPSMYLVASSNEIEDMLPYAQAGFRCYEQGSCISDIDAFVERLINKEDKKQKERRQFFNDYLYPPFGRTACDNIIESILKSKL